MRRNDVPLAGLSPLNPSGTPSREGTAEGFVATPIVPDVQPLRFGHLPMPGLIDVSRVLAQFHLW